MKEQLIDQLHVYNKAMVPDVIEVDEKDLVRMHLVISKIPGFWNRILFRKTVTLYFNGTEYIKSPIKIRTIMWWAKLK